MAQRVTLRDIATAVGVSEATVSRGLRTEGHVAASTRTAIHEAALRLGYQAGGDRVSARASRVVGVISGPLDIWRYRSLLAGIQTELDRSRFAMVLLTLEPGRRESGERISELVIHGRIQGVIALGLGYSAVEIKALRALPVPKIVLGASVAGVPSLPIDEGAAVKVAIGHLIDLGHEGIGYVDETAAAGSNRQVLTRRRRAYETALTAEGIPPRDDWEVDGGWNIDTAFQQAKSFLRQPGAPMAWLAASDEIAFGLLLAAAALGRSVPTEVAVAALGGHPSGDAFGLTTVDPGDERYGEAAARWLTDALLAGSFRHPVAPLVKPRLVPRSSTRHLVLNSHV